MRLAEAALDEAMDGAMALEGTPRKRKRQKRKEEGGQTEGSQKGSGRNADETSAADAQADAEPSKQAEPSTPNNFSRLGALQCDADGNLPSALRRA